MDLEEIIKKARAELTEIRKLANFDSHDPDANVRFEAIRERVDNMLKLLDDISS